MPLLHSKLLGVDESLFNSTLISSHNYEWVFPAYMGKYVILSHFNCILLLLYRMFKPGIDFGIRQQPMVTKLRTYIT